MKQMENASNKGLFSSNKSDRLIHPVNPSPNEQKTHIQFVYEPDTSSITNRHDEKRENYSPIGNFNRNQMTNSSIHIAKMQTEYRQV